jgi:hypothetical protein
MLRLIIRLGLILIVGILIYNYFLGSPEEKATSEKIFSGVRDLGKATWDLLRSEKEKFDQGKYDGAMDKVDNIFGSLKRATDESKDPSLARRFNELNERRLALKTKLDAQEKQRGFAPAADSERLRKEYKSLLDETEQLMRDLEGRR